MRQRIKVLELISTLFVGGAERLLPGLASQLDPERFEVHLCSLLHGDTLKPAYEQTGLPLHMIRATRFYEPRAFAGLARYVRQQRFDVIHTHLTEADIVGRIVGRLLRIPVVSTMHSIPGDYDRQKIHRRTLQRLTARSLATKIIAVSPSLQSRYVREWSIPPDRIVAIPNAVPLEQYLAVPEGVRRPPGMGPIVTNIGRLAPPKAQHLLLDAASMVLKQRPDVRFMIVGSGPLQQQLNDQSRALGLEGRVIFTGLRHDIPDILAQSDIFVLSSLWEGLPATAIEAMAAARPVVLTDVGGCADLVDQGIQGLIVPPDNVPALADALLELLEDEACRLAMGRAGRARIQRDFSMELYVRMHESLYESLASQGRGAPGRAPFVTR